MELEVHRHVEINARILAIVTKMFQTLSPEVCPYVFTLHLLVVVVFIVLNLFSFFSLESQLQSVFNKEIELTKAEIEVALKVSHLCSLSLFFPAVCLLTRYCGT